MVSLIQSQALFDPVIAGSGTHELIYRVGDGNCIVFDTLEVTVIDFTGISAGPEQDACINDTPFPTDRKYAFRWILGWSRYNRS